MSMIFFLLAAPILFYWFWGRSQSVANRPEILRGPLSSLGILALGILLAALGFLL